VNNEDINKEVYFINGKYLDKLNALLYINNNKFNFNTFIIPKIEGKYEVKLVLRSQITDCSFMFQDIKNVVVNTDVAKSIGLTDMEIHKLQKDIENWQFDADIYNLRVRVDELNDSIAYAIGKRGRPTRDVTDKKNEIKAIEELIKIRRHNFGRRGKDKTKDENGRAKKFEIKSLDDKHRRSIEGLFVINPKLKDMRLKLKGKHVVVFDDNISSGATLDDICLELQKWGVASILPITLAIIPKTVYGNHEKLK
jgi:hypothetical protein